MSLSGEEEPKEDGQVLIPRRPKRGVRYRDDWLAEPIEREEPPENESIERPWEVPPADGQPTPSRRDEAYVKEMDEEVAEFLRKLPRGQLRNEEFWDDPNAETFRPAEDWKGPEPRELPSASPAPPREVRYAIPHEPSEERDEFLKKLRTQPLAESELEGEKNWNGPTPRALPERGNLKPRREVASAIDKRPGEIKSRKWYHPLSLSKLIGKILPIIPLARTFARRRADEGTLADRERSSHRRSQRRRLENRETLSEGEREVYGENWTDLFAQSEWERRIEEEELARSTRGKLAKARSTGWLFSEGTVRLERMVVTGALALLLGCACVAYFRYREDKQPTVEPAALGANPFATAGVSGRKSVARADEAEILARRFLGAARWEDTLGMIRQPDLMRPLMERWHEAHPWEPVEDFEVDATSVESVGEKPFIIIYLSREERPFRQIACESTEAGLKIDWETAVGYQSQTWTELRSSKPTTTTFLRVRIRREDYYNFAFDDSDRWIAFRLEHPQQTGSIFGYVERRGPLGEELLALANSPDTRAAQVVLGLRYPEAARVDDQLEIVELFSKTWELPYGPDQSRVLPKLTLRDGGNN